jgi:hypothetical protein
LPDDPGLSPEVGQTAGIDLALNTRNFLGNKNLQGQAFVVWNSNPDPMGTPDLSVTDLTARGVRLSYPNDVWTGHTSYREFGNAYDPTLGFVTRNNFRRLENRVGWSPRPSISWIRSFSFHTQLRNQWQIGSGVLEDQEFQVKLLGVNLESGDGIDITSTRSREYLENDFTVSRDPIQPVTIPGMADYAWWETRAIIRTTGRRMLSAFGGATFGSFWTGDRISWGGRATFKPNPGISLSTNLQVNEVSMPSSLCVTTEPTCDFKASVYEVEGQWNPSPWVSISNQVQYDDQSDLVGLFARLRWIVTPGSDIYFVYTHNWQDLGGDLFDRDRRDLIVLSRGASIKANYTYRF